MTPQGWLVQLPKVELHVHLEGSMSVQTVDTLSRRHGVDPATVWPSGLPAAFSFVDFPDFARQFFYGLSLLRTGADLATVTEDLATVLAAQNVRYAEVTTTAFTHFLDKDDRVGMSDVEYKEGLNEGRRLAAGLGVDIGWVIDIPRDLEMPDSMVTSDYLAGAETPDGLVAIGLGGYEVGFPAAPYADHFARATAAGLKSVPHAGETEGAHSVRSAVEDLGANRIGHGVRCLEDPALVDLLATQEIMLEVCPTSNALLGVVEALDAHPLPELIDRGLRVCLNTDDPGWFATDLLTELEIGAGLIGAGPEQLRVMQLDALAASFASPATKKSVSDELVNASLT